MTFRIGAGAGFSGDRIAPALRLVEEGALDVIVFECLAERTIALAQLARLKDPGEGFDPLLRRRMQAVLPAARRTGTKIVTNMGAANPLGAARAVIAVARALGLAGLKVAAVTGDDVLESVRGSDLRLDGRGPRISDLGPRLVSANAYTGAFPIAEALAAGADVVVTGRAADPALFLGPLIHRYDWAADDWVRLGRGTLVGHLLECAAQVSGGYFADPGVKEVPGLADLGFPLAEVSRDGGAVITKLPGTGGQVTRATCTEQLLYEIHDPAAYLQPDVVADFSRVEFTEEAPDRIRVGGASGHPRTGSLKVSVGYGDGWLGEGQITYAGPGAVARARLAADLVAARIAPLGNAVTETRRDLIGFDSARAGAVPDGPEPREVRLRFAARCADAEAARAVAEEVEALYLNGPAGGGGVTRSLREIVAIGAVLIPEAGVRCRVEVLTA